MKKKIIGILASIIFIMGFIAAGESDENYTRKYCWVRSVEGTIVTIEDLSGNFWEIYATGFKKGEQVNLKMKSNHTDYIEDDIVTGIERA